MAIPCWNDDDAMTVFVQDNYCGLRKGVAFEGKDAHTLKVVFANERMTASFLATALPEHLRPGGQALTVMITVSRNKDLSPERGRYQFVLPPAQSGEYDHVAVLIQGDNSFFQAKEERKDQDMAPVTKSMK